MTIYHRQEGSSKGYSGDFHYDFRKIVGMPNLGYVHKNGGVITVLVAPFCGVAKTTHDLGAAALRFSQVFGGLATFLSLGMINYRAFITQKESQRYSDLTGSVRYFSRRRKKMRPSSIDGSHVWDTFRLAAGDVCDGLAYGVTNIGKSTKGFAYLISPISVPVYRGCKKLKNRIKGKQQTDKDHKVNKRHRDPDQEILVRSNLGHGTLRTLKRTGATVGIIVGGILYIAASALAEAD